MSIRSITIPIRFVTELMARQGEHDEIALACVEQAGIAPALLTQEAARVTVEQFGTFYRKLATALDDETPGLFSRPLRGGTLKFLCLSLLDAGNLGVALHRFGGFFRLLLDDLHFRMTEDGATTRIELVERADLGAQRVLILELMLTLVQGVASWMTGRKLPFIRVDLAYPPPAHAAEYIHMYAGPAHFDQAATAFHVESRHLAAPLRQDKAALSTFLRNAPTDWIHVRVSERLMTHRVRDHLEAHLETQVSIDNVARALHTSTRTLARRLAAEGTSFQAVKDALRRDTAIARLSRTDEPIALIGAALGFDDPTAFNRAFKHWTGSAPGAYRKHRGAGTLAAPAPLRASGR